MVVEVGRGLHGAMVFRGEVVGVGVLFRAVGGLFLGYSV